MKFFRISIYPRTIEGLVYRERKQPGEKMGKKWWKASALAIVVQSITPK